MSFGTDVQSHFAKLAAKYRARLHTLVSESTSRGQKTFLITLSLSRAAGGDPSGLLLPSFGILTVSAVGSEQSLC